MPDNEQYSNPIAPANYRPHDDTETDSAHPLTNDDFRKLLMTPAAPGSIASQRYHNSAGASSQQKPSNSQKGEGSSEAGDKRKKKKQYYAKVIREEKAREEERAKKYRDRARERREIISNEDQIRTDLTTNPSQQAAPAGNYKSVAPDAKGNFDAAARRKQMIEESKFLGGDLEHTHLVKGLDYALLQKVRAEIGPEDTEEQTSLNKDEHIFVKPTAKITPIGSGTSIEKKKVSSNETTPSTSAPVTPEEEEEQRLGLKSSMAKNIFRILFRPPPRRINELFLPHRMAYIIDLENLNGQQDDDNEKNSHTLDDMPTTLIRSKADCPNAETTTTMSNNDIVINKLTQILSYLRHSKRDLKRQKKKGTGIFSGLEPEINIKPIHDSINNLSKKTKSISMYDEIGDYIPDTKRRSITNNEREKNQYENESRKKNYFHSDSRPHDRKPSNAAEIDQDNTNNAEVVKKFIRNVHNKYNTKNNEERSTPSLNSSKKGKSGFQLQFTDDSYAECYPGTMAEEDVNIDSDDEPDLDKMDMGSKKGPIGRWDFDTAEEYSDYMGQKEAMPKAAFQYGVKMNDGRKTRRGVGPKDEKQKLEREWQQISKIIESKRKGDPISSTSPDGSGSKRAKMP